MDLNKKIKNLEEELKVIVKLEYNARIVNLDNKAYSYAYQKFELIKKIKELKAKSQPKSISLDMNHEQKSLLKQGVTKWNKWRDENPSVKINLSNCDFTGQNLSGINLSSADLRSTIFQYANLKNANFTKANLERANMLSSNLEDAIFIEANLEWAILNSAVLLGANLTKANLSNTNLNKSRSGKTIFQNSILIESTFRDAIIYNSDLTRANLSNADMSGADLSKSVFRNSTLKSANLTRTHMFQTDFSCADLSDCRLVGAICMSTNFDDANIEGAYLYGISVWDISTSGLKQHNLIITKKKPTITVDNLEVAQFIYLMLNNSKIRDVIGTIAKKGVLILGRFTPERKLILDGIRNKLRQLDFVPMMFDFEKVSSRDFTETIKVLAGLSRFVIADITNPKSSPLELQATVPNFKIPFLPIIQKNERPFSMFSDLKIYDWFLEIIEYESEYDLMAGFQKGIIDRAISAERVILEKKNIESRSSLDFKDFKN